jgi:hypothetical protein
MAETPQDGEIHATGQHNSANYNKFDTVRDDGEEYEDQVWTVEDHIVFLNSVLALRLSVNRLPVKT